VAFDPPWRLDPLRNIVNVGWKGAANILMVHVSVNVQLHAPRSVPVQPLHLSSIADAFGDPIRQNDAHIPAPVIVDPVSSDMLAHAYLAVSVASGAVPKPRQDQDAGGALYS
jgi:hypothetical protein